MALSAGLDGLLWRLAAADLAATLVIFGFSLRHDNTSLYDPYWSVIPLALAPYVAVVGWGGGADGTRALLVVALVGFWGVRLTHNWARGWTGLDHEDWRYVAFREPGGRAYWLISLFAFHLFPTVQVFLGCLPVVAACAWSGRPLGWLDGLATLVTAGAVILELVADNQLRDFVRERRRPGQTMTQGVWSWCRHPNYLGEIGFWCGLYLFGLAALGPSGWWLGVGALAMIAMFNFASIPLIEKRMAKRRSDYAEVCARIPRLLPWGILRRQDS
ncbi:DUF1295 domain-containing protein [Pseudenhygromyxa sp. WMMC2535]|nr:DUF1295 domain-containing protein [Pseudenhygromyxa sp. WMMC2535]NVB39855.1 DUF1295 domain-containing protein [Pseudenhygromyxa sp. WMMC2535]